jgi:hypothetical protein
MGNVRDGFRRKRHQEPASARMIRCTAPIMSFAPEKRGFLLAMPLPQLERAGHVDQ